MALLSIIWCLGEELKLGNFEASQLWGLVFFFFFLVFTSPFVWCEELLGPSVHPFLTSLIA